MSTDEKVYNPTDPTKPITVCCHCRRVKNDDGSFSDERVDVYALLKSNVKITHTMCLDCVREVYPDHAEEIVKAAREKSIKLKSREVNYKDSI